MNSISYQEYLASCCRFAKEAGEVIMGFFEGAHNARTKDDNSPVTDADIAANTLIVKALHAMAPEIPIIAEEDDELGQTGHERFWLVDPLDGTRSFVRGEKEFTVNIGLIQNRSPVLGVIYVPPTQVMYFGCKGHGAWRQLPGEKPQPIAVRKPAKDGLVVVKSRS
ncbi:MAG: 3'(2'),5'-bisphosphate nucleotidase CysQ, partial [Rickettsiales bacterium]|nr:3'(2'),5'-bisphosphate nucleotidase CysQ [Rickettsiales bacterium]